MAGDSLPSILDLVEACNRGDAAAWVEFVARTQPLIARSCLAVLRRWGVRDPARVEELVQDCYTKLVAGGLLAQFESRHPDAFFGYLKVVATRLAQDQCKAAFAGKRGAAATVPLEDSAVVPAASPSADDEILMRQVEDCVGALASREEVNRDLLIFQLYYRLGLSAAAIASIPALGLSLKGVESFLMRLTRALREKLGEGGREKAAHGVD